MINVHAKNATASEGKIRLNEMDKLRETAPSTSNQKILSSMASLAAVLAYMRSFWSPEIAQAQTFDALYGNLIEEELAICEIKDIDSWRAEMASAMNKENRAFPKQKRTEVKDLEAMTALKGQESAKVVNLPTLTHMGPDTATQISFTLDAGPRARSRSHSFEPTTFPAHGLGTTVTTGSAVAATSGAAAPSGEPGVDDGDDPSSTVPDLETPPAPEPAPSTPQLDTEPPIDDIGDPFPTDPDLETPPAPEPAPPVLQPGTEPPLNDNDGNGDPQPGQGNDNEQVGADDEFHADNCGCNSCVDTAQADDCDSCEDSAYSEDGCGAEHEEGCDDDNAQTIDLALVEGSLLADILFGTETAEVMSGHYGDDQIVGMGGNDAIMGGTGNDDLDGGAGADLLIGDVGDDIMDGGAGNDLLIGEEGSDRIHGGDGDDRIIGGTGDDILHDGHGRDVIIGGVGDDSIHLAIDGEVDIIYGETGTDSLDLSAAHAISRTDIARGEVTLDDGPTDRFYGVEIFVSGSAEDEFDFSGLAASAKPDDAPMFFQITDFGHGDTVRINGEFTLGFNDLSDDSLWPSAPDEVSELEARIRETTGDDANAVPNRLSFRNVTEEDMLARVMSLDFDGDGRFDLSITLQHEPSQDMLPFTEQA
jgi:Ca2+-binding RTX toxin-like protein